MPRVQESPPTLGGAFPDWCQRPRSGGGKPGLQRASGALYCLIMAEMEDSSASSSVLLNFPTIYILDLEARLNAFYHKLLLLEYFFSHQWEKYQGYFICPQPIIF